VKRTLERELKVLEIVEREAYGAGSRVAGLGETGGRRSVDSRSESSRPTRVSLPGPRFAATRADVGSGGNREVRRGRVGSSHRRSESELPPRAEETYARLSSRGSERRLRATTATGRVRDVGTPASYDPS